MQEDFGSVIAVSTSTLVAGWGNSSPSPQRAKPFPGPIVAGASAHTLDTIRPALHAVLLIDPLIDQQYSRYVEER